jgi:predicted MFS family arabinose efflux permease
MRSWRRVALLLFAVAWGTNHFVPLLLVYRADLGLSPVELAVLFGVYAVGLVPGLLLGGPLSDRWGRRAVVLPASVVALAGTCILTGGAAGFAVLLAGRFVVGLGAGATFSAGTAWVQDLAADAPSGTGARRAAISLSCGFGGGPLVTGLLAQWLPRPMLLPYVVHGLVLTASIGAAALDPRRPPARAHAPGGPRWRLVVPPGFARVGLVAPWVFVFPSVSHAVLPALVRARLGSFSVLFAGVVTATTLLPGVLVQPVLRTWRPRDATAFGLASGAAGLLCGAAAASAASPVGVLFAAALLGTGYGGCLIAGLRFVESSTAPETRGGLTGLYYTLTYLGFASPLVLAAVGRRIGDAPSLAGASALAVVTLCAVLSERGAGGAIAGGEEA